MRRTEAILRIREIVNSRRHPQYGSIGGMHVQDMIRELIGLFDEITGTREQLEAQADANAATAGHARPDKDQETGRRHEHG